MIQRLNGPNRPEAPAAEPAQIPPVSTSMSAPSLTPPVQAEVPVAIDRRKLARFRAETDRVKVLVDFLSRPVHAHGGADPDPDIVTAYNLAVEAALTAVRRASEVR